MLLLSRESPLKMSAELVPDESTQIKDNSFVLLHKFTDNHQINSVLEDKQQAIFVTQSFHVTNDKEDQSID